MKRNLIKILFALTAGLFYFCVSLSANGANNLAIKKDIILKQAPNLKPNVLELALKAYNKAQSEKLTTKSIVTIIDYSLASDQKRFWIIDLNNNKVLENTLVAHGKGSGSAKNATKFSNVDGSKASSLGTFITGNTYYGRNGLSLKLNGIVKGLNDKALARTIVLHASAYVNENYAAKNGFVGRSWGCPAVPQNKAHKIISLMKNGTVLFSYYPDSHLLQHSDFLTNFS